MNDEHNPIAEILGGREPAGKLRAFDWIAHGVERKYLIIFTGRSGSTWLAKLIARTQLLPEPDELFNPAFIRRQLPRLSAAPNAGEYLSNLAPRVSKSGTFGAEIDALRLRWLDALIDFGSVFGAADTRYVWLSRDDIVSQAFSFAAARASGRWHQVGDGHTGQTGNGLPITHADILKELRHLVSQEEYARRFFGTHGIEPFRTSYEEMIADTPLALSRVMRHVGASPRAEELALAWQADTTKRLEYDAKTAMVLDFEESHEPLVSYLRSNRRSLDMAGMRIALGDGA